MRPPLARVKTLTPSTYFALAEAPAAAATALTWAAMVYSPFLKSASDFSVSKKITSVYYPQYRINIALEIYRG
jgi:hypothetical protein